LTSDISALVSKNRADHTAVRVMKKTHNQRLQAKRSPTDREARHIRMRVLACVAILSILLGGWYVGTWYFAPAPPIVSLQNMDPAVADILDAARREVWWHPHGAASWGRLGQLFLAHGYRAESSRCFAQAERLDPNEPRWPYLQGSTVRLDDPEAAIGHLRRAVALCGAVPDAPELCLAEVCLGQNRLDDAEHHFRHVLEVDPGNARAHLGLGRLGYERGDLRGALAHLQVSTSSKLTQKASFVLRAQIFHLLGDEAAASRERAQAAGLPEDPPWPDPFFEETLALQVGKQAGLARLHMLNRQDRIAEARTLAHRLEDQYPEIYWLVEGREQMDRGNLAAAEEALRKAVRLAPDSVDTYVDLGTVLFRQKNYGAAADCFQKVIELVPGHGAAYRSLGECQRAQGNRAAAIEAFRTSLRYVPQSAETHRDLGSLLAEDGQSKEALVHLRQALQLAPGDLKTKEVIEETARKVH
jgi:protein O-GlcNAc transferase